MNPFDVPSVEKEGTEERKWSVEGEKIVGESDYYLLQSLKNPESDQARTARTQFLQLEASNLATSREYKVFDIGDRSQYPSNEEEREELKDGLRSLRDGVENEASKKASEAVNDLGKSLWKKLEASDGKNMEDRYIHSLDQDIDRRCGRETAVDDSGGDREVEHRLRKLEGFMNATAADGNFDAAIKAFCIASQVRRTERRTLSGTTIEYRKDTKLWDDPEELAREYTADGLISLQGQLEQIAQKTGRVPEAVVTYQNTIESALAIRRR